MERTIRASKELGSIRGPFGVERTVDEYLAADRGVSGRPRVLSEQGAVGTLHTIA
jgi:hypothetical protein